MIQLITEDDALNKTSIPGTTLIGVHDGVFHADDVFSVAVLDLYYSNQTINVVRTRDDEILQHCNVVVDIGGEYDSEHCRFDHHQEGGAGVHPGPNDHIENATFGLVWNKYGTDILLGIKTPFRLVREVAGRVDRTLVQPVDIFDTGQPLKQQYDDIHIPEDVNMLPPPTVPQFNISVAIAAFNPVWNATHPDFDAAFLTAVLFARMLLLNVIAQQIGAAQAMEHLSTVIVPNNNPSIVVLSAYCPWQEVICGENAKALYVVFPALNGNWNAQCVPIHSGTRRPRRAFPLAWSAKRNDAFVAVTGVQDANFCHNGRWVVQAKTKGGAIRLAELALHQ